MTENERALLLETAKAVAALLKFDDVPEGPVLAVIFRERIAAVERDRAGAPAERPSESLIADVEFWRDKFMHENEARRRAEDALARLRAIVAEEEAEIGAAISPTSSRSGMAHGYARLRAELGVVEAAT